MRRSYVRPEFISCCVSGSDSTASHDWKKKQINIPGIFVLTMFRSIDFIAGNAHMRIIGTRIRSVIQFSVYYIKDCTGLDIPWCSLPFKMMSLVVELTPWNRVVLEKLTVAQLVKEYPTINETRRPSNMSTTVCHFTLLRAKLIRSESSYSISLRSILILSSCLCLRLRRDPFP